MIVAALVSAVHVLAVAAAFVGIVGRARACRDVVDRGAVGLPAVFAADNVWGISALALAASGLARAFGGLEKGSFFYTHSGTFFLKMGLLALVLGLELWPMITLIRWRVVRGRGGSVEEVVVVSAAATIGRISRVQLALTVVLVAVAALMARGALMMG